MSKRNENYEKRADQTTPASPTFGQGQETPQTSAADPLIDYRYSLGEIRSLAGELARFSQSKAELESEAKDLRSWSEKVADKIVIDPATRESGEAELEKTYRREAIVTRQIEALERVLWPAQEALQKLLIADLDAFGRLADALCADTLSKETARLLVGIEPNEETSSSAAELAKCSLTYRQARVILPGVSFAWSRPLQDNGQSRPLDRREWSEIRAQVVSHLQTVATELVIAAEMLLAKAAAIANPPAFKLPPPPVAETHLEWNEPLQKMRTADAPVIAVTPATETDFVIYDPCDRKTNIDKMFDAVRKENPGVTLIAELNRLFFRKYHPTHPGLFKSQSEVQQMHQSPPQPVEVDWTKVPMEGDTFAIATP